MPARASAASTTMRPFGERIVPVFGTARTVGRAAAAPACRTRRRVGCGRAGVEGLVMRPPYAALHIGASPRPACTPLLDRPRCRRPGLTGRQSGGRRLNSALGAPSQAGGVPDARERRCKRLAKMPPDTTAEPWCSIGDGDPGRHAMAGGADDRLVPARAAAGRCAVGAHHRGRAARAGPGRGADRVAGHRAGRACRWRTPARWRCSRRRRIGFSTCC